MTFAPSAVLAIIAAIGRPESACGISVDAFVMPKFSSRTKRRNRFDSRTGRFVTLLEAAKEEEQAGNKEQQKWLEGKNVVKRDFGDSGGWRVSSWSYALVASIHMLWMFDFTITTFSPFVAVMSILIKTNNLIFYFFSAEGFSGTYCRSNQSSGGSLFCG